MGPVRDLPGRQAVPRDRQSDRDPRWPAEALIGSVWHIALRTVLGW